MTTRWRAGVRGDPIEHSLSPALHAAAYAALGLHDWSYDRQRLRPQELAAHVAGLDTSWRGLSVTMPLKEAALALADGASDLARLTGAANTLLRRENGWYADNTDVAGLAAALRSGGVQRPTTALVIGSGATARSALAALHVLGVQRCWLAVRDTLRPETAALTEQLGLRCEAIALGEWPFGVEVIVGTVPGQAYLGTVGALPAGSGVVLDCVYGDGPSPLLATAAEAGYTAVPGTEMLLLQAVEQVRLMTGRQPPVAPMRAALPAALHRG